LTIPHLLLHSTTTILPATHLFHKSQKESHSNVYSLKLKREKKRELLFRHKLRWAVTEEKRKREQLIQRKREPTYRREMVAG
jgi:hypothetical protein